jgi:RES domain-containing protein
VRCVRVAVVDQVFLTHPSQARQGRVAIATARISPHTLECIDRRRRGVGRVDAITHVSAIPVGVPRIVWVRQRRPGVGPVEPVTFDSRWQRAGTPAAYYADSEPTAWAELHRGLAERGLAPGDVFPRDLHHLDVDLTHVADLSTERARKALGLPRVRQTHAQWPAFQDVGEQLAAVGAQAILYSSAARTRSLCLCVSAAWLAHVQAASAPVHVLAPPAVPRGLRT